MNINMKDFKSWGQKGKINDSIRIHLKKQGFNSFIEYHDKFVAFSFDANYLNSLIDYKVSLYNKIDKTKKYLIDSLTEKEIEFVIKCNKLRISTKSIAIEI